MAIGYLNQPLRKKGSRLAPFSVRAITGRLSDAAPLEREKEVGKKEKKCYDAFMSLLFFWGETRMFLFFFLL